MIIAITLFGYAALMATGGAWLLRESAWPAQAPRLAIAVWQALAASVLLSVMLGAVALSVRLHLVSTDLAELFHLCVTNLRAAYATPGGATTTTIALAALVLVATRAVWGVATTLRQAVRQRRRQLRILELVARRDAELDVLVLEHPTAAAFCLPGRNRNIVVTSSALAVLSREEVHAVVAHEKAHLRGRHHLLLAVSHGLVRAFPGVPVFNWGDQQVRRLVELVADDRACRNHPRSAIASAILQLADSAAPAAALALGAEAVHLRLQRLTGRRPPMRRATRSILCALVAAVLIAPAIVAALPALVLAGMDYCSLS
ncbi:MULTISPECIES: M56 family metallopeptidase [unclassified Kribbella]|uniref:M56 family metallopeptidase n=1 Tax=unclassified Kribbella TaxID=2644121 RepID=UPI003015CACB